VAQDDYARENGVGSIEMQFGIDGVPVSVISFQQLSSTCRVTLPTDTEQRAAGPQIAQDGGLLAQADLKRIS
jgi:hypothetical protein